MKLYWACCSLSVLCDFKVVSVIAELASLRLSVVVVVRRCVVCVGANARRTGEDWYCDWLNTESLLCTSLTDGKDDFLLALAEAVCGVEFFFTCIKAALLLCLEVTSLL